MRKNMFFVTCPKGCTIEVPNGKGETVPMRRSIPVHWWDDVVKCGGCGTVVHRKTSVHSEQK